ncbi:hypothetical protein [Edaphobacter bradus]|uniref:hypothetical protein n=1 Tax=Edaphobacter bradus TaxID=2259016 RepID=UPI0021E085D1|nr:hypothetical protein [Edaphobacter bradus]
MNALIGNFVLVPLLGILIAWIIPLPLNIEEGLLLLAALLFLLAALSLVLTPPLPVAEIAFSERYVKDLLCFTVERSFLEWQAASEIWSRKEFVRGDI